MFHATGCLSVNSLTINRMPFLSKLWKQCNMIGYPLGTWVH